MMPPHFWVSRPGVVERSRGLGEVPMAMMTQSTASSNSLPSWGTGRRRPDSSGSPRVIFTQRMAVTFLCSSPRISTGLLSSRNSTPSSWACSTSSRRAGSSSMERR